MASGEWEWFMWGEPGYTSFNSRISQLHECDEARRGRTEIEIMIINNNFEFDLIG
jgi:hypothetical protein